MDAGGTVFQKIVDNEAPEEFRAAVASGLIPIPPAETGAVLSALIDDPVESVREQARAHVAALPLEAAREVGRDRRIGGTLLRQLITAHGDDPLLTNIVLNHPLVGPDTLQLLIYKGTPETLRTIATLTPKLRAHPHLIGVLQRHQGLSAESREHLQFLAESLARKEVPEAPETDGIPEDPLTQEEIDLAAIEAAGAASVPAQLHEEMTSDEEADSEKKKGWFEKILHMTVSEKIYWAMKGNKEVRMNLVRDANKMVSLSVIKSPRLTIGEVETIANSTNVAADILRAVTMNREFFSKHPVQCNLAKNPKTPPGIVLRLLPKLQKRDLQAIVGNKGISDAVRSSANRLLKRGKG